MNILNAFNDLNLFQLVNFPTTLSGNTLDIFWPDDPQKFVVYHSEKTYSDHDSFFAQMHVSSDDCFTPDDSKQMYSKKSFNTERFSGLLEPLYTKFYSNPQNDFLSFFDISIKAALDDSCHKKSKRRLNFPYYYSSRSTQLANKLRTLRRKQNSHLSRI